MQMVFAGRKFMSKSYPGSLVPAVWVVVVAGRFVIALIIA